MQGQWIGTKGAQQQTGMDICRVGGKGQRGASYGYDGASCPAVFTDAHRNAARTQFLGIAGGGGVADIRATQYPKAVPGVSLL